MSAEDARRRSRKPRGGGAEAKVETHTFQGSSRVDKASYDPDTMVVTVQFPDRVKWRYRGVRAETWVEFKRAPSPGRFLAGVLEAHSNGPA